MGFPDRPRHTRARLEMERLEDRTTPAKIDDALSVALPELVATGAVAGDRVNVVMTAETNTEADAAALAAAPFAASVQALGFGIYSVTLEAGTDLGTAIAFYGQTAGVVSAAPDTIVQLQRTPNDGSYSSLYGMTKIAAPAAWDVTTGNPNFVVAVIDSGVDYNHPDLAANMWRNPGEVADGLDNDGNGFVDDIFGADFVNNDGNPFDDNSHGTHVAGTIGAVGNNGIGVAGVNWSVQIMALKFLSAGGSGATSGAVRALDYAVQKGAKLSNNSWGGGGADSALSAAIGRARAAGHIFVAAAGNSGLNVDVTPSYPASYIANYDNIVNVAATNGTDTLASFSNYGATRVTLAAPGVGILSTTPSNTYRSFSGTSMAAPHVAGAIALYWGANPTQTYQQVIAKLTGSVDQVAGLAGKVSTGGRLNVAKMFATSPPPTVAPGPKVTDTTFSGATTAQFDKVRVTFDRAVNAASFTTADVVAFVGPNATNLIGTITAVTAVAGTTNQFDITFTARTAGGSYSLTFGPDIRDALGNQMNQNGNGASGEDADRFTAGGALLENVTRTYSTGTISLTINDLSTRVSTINVTDDVRISDLNARVSLTHTYDGDLSITLTSPTVNGVAGRTVTLINRRGGSGDNLTNTGFDDEASVAIANGAAPFNGTYRADGLLSAFDGLSTKGIWTLRVTDNARYDTGRLTNWQFTVAGTVSNGGSGAQSFGFLDDSVALAEPLTESLADPIVVRVSDPFAGASAEPAAEVVLATVSTGSADALFLLLGTEPERRGDAPPVVPGDYAERENRPALSDDFRAPLAAAYATLYFPPDAGSTDSEEDVFEAFAME